jgi:hypothetical protein
MRRAAAAVLSGAALLAVACRQRDDRAAIQERLRAKGTAEVVREAAAARYVPPAGGRLTDAQVRLYLRVRERESRIREAAFLAAQRRRDALLSAERAERADRTGRQDGRDTRDPSDPRDNPGRRGHPADETGLAAADLRASQELRVNPKEYAWVRERVLEAEAAAATQTLYQRMAAGREQLLARMRRDRDALTDPERRAAAERQIEDWKRGLQASEPAAPAAVRANVALLARYREALARLRALEERALAAAAGLELPAAGGTTATAR